MGKTKKALKNSGQDSDLVSGLALETEAGTQHDEEVQFNPPACPYLSPIISVMVGWPSKEFKVHLDIMFQFPLLYSKVENSYDTFTLQLPKVESSLFELVSCYLYRGNYQEYQSSTNPFPKGADVQATTLKRHALLHCFALKYQMDELAALTMVNTTETTPISYEKVLSIAREIYKELPDEEISFRNFFKEETKRALTKNLGLSRESCVLEALEGGSGKLAVDLFTIFTTTYENRYFKSHTSKEETKALNEPLSGEDTTTSEVLESAIPNFDEGELIEVISANKIAFGSDASMHYESECSYDRLALAQDDLAEPPPAAREELPAEEIPQEDARCEEEYKLLPPQESADTDGVISSKPEAIEDSDFVRSPLPEAQNAWAGWLPLKKDARRKKNKKKIPLNWDIEETEAPDDCPSKIAEVAETLVAEPEPASEDADIAQEIPPPSQDDYTPSFATEEGAADAPAAYDGLITKKNKKKAKRARFQRSPSPDLFATRPDPSDLEKVDELSFELTSPPAPVQTEELLLSADETGPCTRRGFHLAKDSRWIKCGKCRGELGALARKISKSNPGWDFTSLNEAAH